MKCVKSGKWFCNGRVTGSASCILTHLASFHSSAATDRQRAGFYIPSEVTPVFRLQEMMSGSSEGLRAACILTVNGIAPA